MNNSSVTANSIKAWFLAARPKTLTGAVAPVLVGGSMAFSTGGDGIIFLFCLLFAICMQIDANFINDYFDFRKGTDREDRLGPERACAQGWITPSAMRWGILLTTVLSCLVGLIILILAVCDDFSTLINMATSEPHQFDFSSVVCPITPEGFQRGIILLLVGLFCVVFSFLYTTSLSYLGLGDLLVLVFFGLIPVVFTHYVMTQGQWSYPLLTAGIAMGLVTDSLLMVNNYRDRHQDKLSGKRTIVVRIIQLQTRRLGTEVGQQSASLISLRLYLWLGILSALFGFVTALLLGDGHIIRGLLSMFLFMGMHFATYRKMLLLDGKALNSILGATARNIFFFGLLLAFTVL